MPELKAVDLFAGAGGGSIGLERAGIEVIGAVDIDDAAIETFENNPVDVDPMQADLTEITFLEIAQDYGFEIDDVNLILGCPPCQNFSSLRDTTPWTEGEAKDDLLVAFYQHIREAKPEFVIFENVPGIVTTENGVYLEWLVKRMDELGYGKDIDVLNAADYGVPQFRRRAIGLFAWGRSDDEVELPDGNHSPPDEVGDQGRLDHRTVRMEIDELPQLDPGEKWDDDPAHRARNHQESTLDIIRAVPKDGGSRSDIEDESLILDCHKNLDDDHGAASVYGRMTWNEPAPTLTTRCTIPSCGRFIHPEQNRGISFREAARLMALPDFKLPNINRDAERVIGNAVPPPLIEEVSRKCY